MIKIKSYNNENIIEEEFDVLTRLENEIIINQSKKQLYFESQVKFDFKSRVQIKNLHVIVFNFSVMNLIQVPPEIKNFKHLEHLNLRGNLIYTIPEWIGDLIELKILNLAVNWISNLPDTLPKLINLCHLNLSANFFHQIPSVLNKLPHLSKLDISCNNINSLFGISPNIVSLIIPNLVIHFEEEKTSSLSLSKSATKLIEKIIQENDIIMEKRSFFQHLLKYYNKSIEQIFLKYEKNQKIEPDLMERLIVEISPKLWLYVKSKFQFDSAIQNRIHKQLDYCDFHNELFNSKME